jgi:hypothetical protein
MGGIVIAYTISCLKPMLPATCFAAELANARQLDQDHCNCKPGSTRMNDETTRILAQARDYPLLIIDARRAGQIADECSRLREACDLATRRFGPGEATRFAALFAAPMNGSRAP